MSYDMAGTAVTAGPHGPDGPAPDGAGAPGALIAALDIGGTKIAGGLVDEHGVLRHRVRVPTPATGDRDELMTAVDHVLDDLSRHPDWLRVRALGIGSAGPGRRPRRIAMLSVHTSPLHQPGTGDAGGMNVYIVELAKRLADLDIEVEVFTRAVSSDDAPTVELAPGVLVRHVTAGPYEGLLKEDLPAQLCAFTHGVLRTEAGHRTGYVYVISNVGAFGEHMVKIGLTRRLEPLDRIYELSGASVPFRFDVHALIFSDDAVGLETKLHQHFADRRVNQVNTRREFFYVSPAEVRDALQEYVGQHLVEFTEVPEALEWRASGGSPA